MAVLRPFTCIRPDSALAAKIASGPHSAMSQEAIRQKLLDNPLSYSRIVHPKSLGEAASKSPEEAYEMAARTLENWVREHVMVEEKREAFYLYRLESNGHSQTGLVGCTPVDELREQRIRAHEKIRENKLKDLARHVEICGAQIGGPILVAYRNLAEINEWMDAVKRREPLYDFVSENGVHNTIWQILDPKEKIWVQEAMERVPALYIADGHHRAMAAVEICRRQREAHPDYTGHEPWNYFACVCFPDNQLQILPYGRVVDIAENMSASEILVGMESIFHVKSEGGAQSPGQRGEFSMYLDGKWYSLTLKEGLRPSQVPGSLDVAVLHKLALEPVLGIQNTRNDTRLEFVGGLDQRAGVEEKCRKRKAVGFLLHPTSMEELLAVADAGATMPPKSTWFEPKLCNGLFLYTI